MAASAAYVDVVRLPNQGGVSDGFRESNLGATGAAHPLLGGLYGVSCHATFAAGSVTLQVLAADGVTWLTALTAFSADGYATANLMPGSYRIALA